MQIRDVGAERKITQDLDAKMFSPNWQVLSGGIGSGYYDAYQSLREPNKIDLVRAYDDIVYACVSLIASNMAAIPIRLYVRTDVGQRRPKCAIAKCDRKTLDAVSQKWLPRSSQVDEVIDHPLISLLRQANSYHNHLDLFELTQIFLELTGNAFWLIDFDRTDLPERVVLLPTQDVQGERDEDFQIIAWKYGHGMRQDVFPLDRICHFKYANPMDPYGEGYPTVRSIWGKNDIIQKQSGYLANLLENMGRPDALLSVQESLNIDEAERLAKDYYQRFRGQGSGGIFATDGKIDLKPINWPPEQLAELQLFSVIKTNVCNAFHIPPDIFELGQSNRSSAEAVLYAFSVHCLKPRVRRICEKINERLVKYFDSRLFLAPDEVVPDDKDFELRKDQMLLTMQAITRDEVREKYGYASAEWAKEPLLPPGMLPTEEPLPAPDQEPDQGQDQDRVAESGTVAELQKSYFAGEISQEAAIAHATIVLGFTPEQAGALFPAKPEKPAQQAPEAPPPAPVPEPKAIAVKDVEGCVAHKIPILMNEGYDEDQATAIAYSMCGEKAEIPLPDDRQQSNYDCGADAVRVVLEHYGFTYTEQELIEGLGTTPADGTSPEAMVRYLEECGLPCEARQGMTVDDLQSYNQQLIPVICCVQESIAPPEEAAKNLWGHYVVVNNVEGGEVSYQDPAQGKVTQSFQDFDANWHDEGYDHFGIAVKPQEPQTASKSKALTPLQMLDGQHLQEKLISFFQKQRAEVLRKIKKLSKTRVQTKGLADFFDLAHWTEEMFKECKPIIEMYYDHAADKSVTRLGGAMSLLHVVQPKLKEGIAKATMKFCTETQQTTSMELDKAISTLREELEQGLVAGEYRNALMDRVKGVFESADVNRAFLIGVTESSRAQHNAQLIVARESGLVKGKRWLLSSQACDECKPMAGKVVGLDDNFHVDNTRPEPYNEVGIPPLHPGCLCTFVEITD
jgi:HK97 family phage portal protein